MKKALKIGLFIFWLCWLVLFFRYASLGDPLLNAFAVVFSAGIMVAGYFFYGVFLPAVFKTIRGNRDERGDRG